MIRHFLTLGSLLVLQNCVFNVHADDHVEATKAAEKELHGVYPEVNKGDKKFFGKDFPWDKRPPVNVLHFKHPYPVVQDSDDFDKDFVKDENNDNGSWAAQSEYDRLRHKLAMDKKAVAKATHKKDRAEDELQAAMRREKIARQKHEEQLEAKRRAAEAARNKQTPGGGSNIGDVLPEGVKEVINKIPGGIASPGDVEVATRDTKKAMDNLEECKKELAAAREHLKKLMDDLKDAKQQQSETQNALDNAGGRDKELHVAEDTAHNTVKTNYQAYMDARTAYLQQQALVAKMEQDIKVAAAKVAKFRKGEDKNGGVYNSETELDSHGFPLPKLRRSAAHSSVAPLSAFVVSAMVACFAN